MKKLLTVILGIVILSFVWLGCNKQEEQPVTPEVTFTLSISGFDITVSEFSNLKSENAFEDFTHVYPSGSLQFTHLSTGTDYKFQSGEKSIDYFKITLPIGEYSINGNCGSVKPWGEETMGFLIEPQIIIVEENTISVNVIATPRCALILLDEELSSVDTTMFIYNGSYFYFTTLVFVSQNSSYL
ncbi:hypothetical protein ES705_24550 [subsurface metagenome]